MEKLYREVTGSHSGARRRREDDAENLIDDLLDLHQSDPLLFPETDLRMAAFGPFIAALDTVAGTCASMLYALLRNPEVRAEADDLFADSPPTAGALRKMDAMHRAAMEAMRIYAVAPLVVRIAANSFDFTGHRIPAAEQVMIATAVPHHLPECFPEPERIDINRYRLDRAEHRRPYVYAPFGLCGHRCLGNGFAEVQIVATMATLLHEADRTLDRTAYSLTRIRHQVYGDR